MALDDDTSRRPRDADSIQHTMTVVKRKVHSKGIRKNKTSVFGGLAILLGYYAWKRPPKKGPLCDECWQIVKSMPRVDISFEKTDMVPGTVVGARNSQGQLEPFHFDETALHQNPEAFEFDADEFCEKKDDDYKVFREKVFVDMEYERQQQFKTSRPKILCIVYSFEGDHSRIPILRQTWG